MRSLIFSRFLSLPLSFLTSFFIFVDIDEPVLHRLVCLFSKITGFSEKGVDFSGAMWYSK